MRKITNLQDADGTSDGKLDFKLPLPSLAFLGPCNISKCVLFQDVIDCLFYFTTTSFITKFQINKLCFFSEKPILNYSEATRLIPIPLPSAPQTCL